MKKYLFIANAKAGASRHNQKSIKKVRQILDSRKIDYQWIWTEREQHAQVLAREAANKNYHRVVAVGGDGTINEVASGLAGSQIPLGIIALGSGNGFARHLKVPLNPKKATTSILQHKNTRDVDLWDANGRCFLSIAGIGFDAFIAHEMAKMEKRGRWQYVRLVLKKSLSYKPVNIKISVDGQEIDDKALMLSFANACQFGNDFRISPLSKIDDGWLDVVLVKPFSKALYPLFVLAAFLGMPEKFSFYRHLRGKSVVVHSASTTQFHIDGEPLEVAFPLAIRCHNKPVKVSVP